MAAVGSEGYGHFTPEKAHGFGLFLGRRYRESPVIWILGGDQEVVSPEDRAVIAALAAGLREGDGGAHLITYHPRGPGLSSDALRDAPWLDFNMVQSSHGAHDHANGLFMEHDYALTPPGPRSTASRTRRQQCLAVLGVRPRGGALGQPALVGLARHAWRLPEGLVRRLFESRPFTKLAPAPAMLRDAPASGGAKVRAGESGQGRAINN